MNTDEFRGQIDCGIYPSFCRRYFQFDGYLSSQLKISVMKAIDFEKSALEHGLAIGSKKDFFWVESLDDRIWCLLASKSAIDFADSLNLEKEAVEGGAYLIYFSG